MSLAPEPPPRILEFRVVCLPQIESGGLPAPSAYMLHRSAADAPEAMASARAAGHRAVLCLPFGLPRAEETRIVSQWRLGLTRCTRCDYSLVGLPAVEGCIVCPECGTGAAPEHPPLAPSGSRLFRTPRCGRCGYDLSGIAVGPSPLRCPECGSDSPFVR